MCGLGSCVYLDTSPVYTMCIPCVYQSRVYLDTSPVPWRIRGSSPAQFTSPSWHLSKLAYGHMECIICQKPFLLQLYKFQPGAAGLLRQCRCVAVLVGDLAECIMAASPLSSCVLRIVAHPCIRALYPCPVSLPCYFLSSFSFDAIIPFCVFHSFTTVS